MDVIPWGTLTDIGSNGLLIIMVFMIFKGMLVPEKFYKNVLEERDKWKAVCETLEDTNQVQAKTIEKQIDVGDTVVRVMSAIQDQANKGGP